MIYQTPNIDDCLTERAFLIMRRAHYTYYIGIKVCRATDEPIYEATNQLLMEQLGWEVKEAELRYAELKGYCDHRYVKNEDGDYLCSRCQRYNPLYPYYKA